MTLYNINIERSILSSVLYDPLKPEIENLLANEQPDLFYLPFHKAIFKSIQELLKEDKPIDEEFIKSKLQKDNIWDEEGFLEIIAANPLSSIKEYVEILNGYKNKREALKVSSQIKHKLKKDNPEKVLEWSMQELEKLSTQTKPLLNKKKVNEIKSGEANFLTKEWLPIPKSSVALISAPGGTGKTWSVLQLAIRAAMENPNLKAFLWLTEDYEGIIRNRFDAICEKIIFNVSDEVRNRIEIGSDAPIVMLERNRGHYEISHKFYMLKRELREYDLIVIDPLLAFYGGDENDNSQARLFMQPWLDWAKDSGKSIVFVHHSKKNGEFGPKSRGASAFIDAVRIAYELDKVRIKRNKKLIPDPNKLHKRKFTLTKDNWGAIRHLEDFEFERQITPLASAKEVEIVYEDSAIDIPEIV